MVGPNATRRPLNISYDSQGMLIPFDIELDSDKDIKDLMMSVFKVASVKK